MKKYRFILSIIVFMGMLFIYYAINGNPFTQYEVDDQVLEEIINSELDASMTDYEKIKALHDYIIVHTEYDKVNLDNNTIPDIDYTAKGVFTNGIAVCRGYAEAFQLLMQKIGIESKILTGWAKDTSHAWNVVKLNGKWYHVDTTFDDPVAQPGEIYKTPYDNLRYNYFLVTDAQIMLDHIIEDESPQSPGCNSEDYMYLEKKYNTPYEIVNSISDIPVSFSKYYKQGLNTVTFYFKESADLSASGLVQKIGNQLFSKGYEVSNCVYSKVERCGKYYYTTITVK